MHFSFQYYLEKKKQCKPTIFRKIEQIIDLFCMKHMKKSNQVNSVTCKCYLFHPYSTAVLSPLFGLYANLTLIFT